MDASIFIARALGLLFIAVAIGLLVNPRGYRNMLAEFSDSLAMIYMSGAIALVIGVAIIHFHNVWSTDWRVIITLMGWLSLIKGAVRIIYPQFLRDMTERVLARRAFLTSVGAFSLAFGVFLTAMSFYGVRL